MIWGGWGITNITGIMIELPLHNLFHGDESISINICIYKTIFRSCSSDGVHHMKIELTVMAGYNVPRLILLNISRTIKG